MTLFDELSQLVVALDAAKVDYALVGGLAVAVWGIPRATKDIDLLILPQDLAGAQEVARSRGFTLEAFPMEFADGMKIHRLNKIDGPDALLTVDFLLVGASEQPIWDSKQRVPFAERTISVASRAGLIKMKLSAGRPQDLADVQKLKEMDR